jgi:hypothetical protein
LFVGRIGRDGAGIEGGHGGDDLEHRAGDVATLRRPRQQRQRLVRLELREDLLRRDRVGDAGRVVDRGRGEREDLPGLRLNDHDRSAIAAEALDRRLLERQ